MTTADTDEDFMDQVQFYVAALQAQLPTFDVVHEVLSNDDLYIVILNEDGNVQRSANIPREDVMDSDGPTKQIIDDFGDNSSSGELERSVVPPPDLGP